MRYPVANWLSKAGCLLRSRLRGHKSQTLAAREQWTCVNIRIISEAFTTATDEEINNMDNTEFLDCLPDMGTFTSWTDAQKTVLLEKAITAIGQSVCDMSVTDVTSLGVIAQAIPVSDMSCLHLNESDIVSSFGSSSGWSPAELSALAAGYTTSNALSDLSSITSSEISILGSILCGFTTTQIATIPAAVVGDSGGQIGDLSNCGTEALAAFKDLAKQTNAYGAVSDWTAADIGELKYITAGLSEAEIATVTVEALEGLSPDVIPVIPAAVLKMMTTAQLGTFTDAQAVSVTDTQKMAMTDAQKLLLGEASSGGQDMVPQVTMAPSSANRGLTPSTVGLLAAFILMPILST